MSLLMEALKRAEANKQEAARAPDHGGDPASGLSLAPLGAPTDTPAAPSPLPDLASHLATVNADLAATVIPEPRSASTQPAKTVHPGSDQAQQEAARNVFAAKTVPSAPSHRPLGLFLGLAGLAIAAIGGYFWYQLQHIGHGGFTTRPPAVAVPGTPSQAKPPTTTAAQPPAPAPISADIPVPTPEVHSLSAIDRAMAASSLAQRRSPPTPTVAQPGSPVALPMEPPIRLTHSHPEADPALNRGYQLLQGGNLDGARRDYEQALRRDPKNVDALLGLAAVAQRQGRGGEAERLQQAAIEADPKDAAAQAAQIATLTPSDPALAESRLKGALASQPESPPLNFALGNLYSRQGRWSEAQQAYFNSVAGEGDNPDYLFNLAVSLDHIRQPGPAATYYRKALEAGEQRVPAFNKDQVRKRLNDLQPPRSEP